MGIYKRSYEQYEASIQVNQLRYRQTFKSRKEAETWIKRTEIEGRLSNFSRDDTLVKKINITDLTQLV